MIAFCTTVKGRAQHLKQTLPKNLADNAGYADAKFIILDYGSTDDLLGYLLFNHAEDIESGRVVLYRYPTEESFRMSHAKNLAHRLGILEGADVLVNLDADNFTGPGFAEYIGQKFRGRDDIFLWARMIKEGPDRLPRGISGRIVVSSRAFINAGGYDEKYATWGPDDKDFNLRLHRLGYSGQEIDRQFLSVTPHNDKMRFREYPEARTKMGSDEFELVNECDTTIANFGKFGCGTIYRNFDGCPIELGILPTRIFGIGMHKTGTTSLHHAFKILGFDSAHWKSAHWAKAIWQEMNTLGRSRTLERHYALSDLPITLLYKQLDRAYPGSKFILTVRNEEGWLASVRTHWGETNPFRAVWSTDPFTDRIHKKLYGQTEFDADVFLARFRRHNAEVKEYFAGRPDDLFVMDIDESAGWFDLCAFLGKSIPVADYPKANRS